MRRIWNSLTRSRLWRLDGWIRASPQLSLLSFWSSQHLIKSGQRHVNPDTVIGLTRFVNPQCKACGLIQNFRSQLEQKLLTQMVHGLVHIWIYSDRMVCLDWVEHVWQCKKHSHLNGHRQTPIFVPPVSKNGAFKCFWTIPDSTRGFLKLKNKQKIQKGYTHRWTVFLAALLNAPMSLSNLILLLE